MSVWEFATSGRILFGPGTLDETGRCAAELGAGSAFLFLGAGQRHFDQAAESLKASEISIAGRFLIAGEPALPAVLEAAAALRSSGAGCAVAVGGGSVIDAAKAACALAANPGDPFDYLEVIGRGHPLKRRPIPLIACPTTAGTGAEATRNAVVGVPEHRIKVSLRSPWMLPAFAIIDPATTYTLPAEQTAWCGMDALSQLIEPFLSRAANPLTDALCREGLRLASRALPRVFEDGGDGEARRDMAAASLMGGMALANAKLGAVHGFAGPMGGMFPAPHGALCAALLAPVCRANLAAARAGRALPGTIGRFMELGGLLGAGQDPDAAVEWLDALAARLLIPGLGAWGVSSRCVAGILPAARSAGSMKGNPVDLSDAELAGILDEAIKGRG